MDGDANWALSFPREFALWGDPHGELPERPSVLVQDFGLCDPSDLWLFEAAAGRGLAQVHWDSVWIGNASSSSSGKIQNGLHYTICACRVFLESV